MIRINLLPFRAARKKENIRRQISIYFLLVLFLFTIMGYFYLNLNRALGALEDEKARKQKELATYSETTKRIIAAKKKIEETRSKLDIIRRLERDKTGPVQLLAEIATAVPRDRLWLRSLEEKGGILNLEGTAMDNDTVAFFMTRLEGAPHILSVDLKSTKLRVLEKYRMNVTDFILSCKTYSFKEKPKPETQKGAKAKR